MPGAFHPDLAYGFRRLTAVLPQDPSDSRTLAAIEHMLIDAGQAYRERRYDDAVGLYTRARGLIWSQLFPAVDFDHRIATQVDLRRTLVSSGAEWLNLLPVEATVSGARPREVVALPEAKVLGLRAGAVDAQGAAAAADLDMAARLNAAGNDGAAKFFTQRATKTAPHLVTQLQGGAVAPAPATAPAPAPSVTIAPAPHVLVKPPAVNLHTTTVLHRAAPTATGRVATGAGAARLGRIELGTSIAVTPITISAITLPPKVTALQRSWGVAVGDKVQHLAWPAGGALDVDSAIKAVYEPRRTLAVLPDALIAPVHAADAAMSLAHAWYYEIPLGLAECYHAMGQWAAAEAAYLQAAGYDYLNATIEAPYLWARLASLYLAWGNALFRADDAGAALPVYTKVLGVDDTEPGSALYTLAGLKPGADQARDVIAHLADAAAISASPAIASVIFDVQAQLAKIAGGLDFWGHWAQNVPIWTFDYLQSVAVNFCQLAVGAERDAMSFWEKADSGALTRLQLTQNIAQAQAERAAAQAQVAASMQELKVYETGAALARKRADDARANADAYAALSPAWTMHQALSAQLSGGEDGSARQLNRLADRMMQGGYSIEGDRGTLAAAEGLAASRLQSRYEIDRMRREAATLDLATAQAQQEVAAGQARVKAAQAQSHAADVRVDGAQQLLSAFDQQRFTPDTWQLLGDRMNHLAQRYLAMALDVAKRMQRAYNFENDVQRQSIKADYAAAAVHGMLAADTLMADVHSFTFDLVTSSAPKRQPVKQTISLAQRYPYLFESQLRRTGTMAFQTSLDDFDAVYPGTYAGRIEHVEIAVDGIVPARGVSGTLTNAGISHYRTAAGGALKHRVQSREAQVISDYDPRTDTLLVPGDARQRRVFEGAGLASSWTLQLPMDVNSFDFASLVDVRLTITYQARFDPDLRDAVLADLAARPQAHERLRPLPMRWLYPDAFFAFYDSGVLAWSLARGDFPAAENDPRLLGLSLVAATTPRARAAGIVLRVSTPGHGPVTVTTAADGGVDMPALAALADGGTALGDYRIEMTAEDNPGWVVDGRLALSALDNLALVLSYGFTPRA